MILKKLSIANAGVCNTQFFFKRAPAISIGICFIIRAPAMNYIRKLEYSKCWKYSIPSALATTSSQNSPF